MQGCINAQNGERKRKPEERKQVEVPISAELAPGIVRGTRHHFCHLWPVIKIPQMASQQSFMCGKPPDNDLQTPWFIKSLGDLDMYSRA